jgi:fibronectin type 3 domain-containing protein
VTRIAALAALAVVLVLAAGGPTSVAAGSSAPTGLTGIALTGDVQLAWQPVSGASGYTVYRGTSPSAVTTLLTPASGVAATSFDDTTASNGTTYDYAVRAIVGGVESANSLIVQAKPVARACSSGNAIVVENCYPGNTGFTVTSPAQVSNGGIEGYATATSVNKGGSVDLKVNSAAGSTFDVQVYRTGYYGGAEARLYSTMLNVPGVQQPSCVSDSSTGFLDCSNWSVSATLTTTSKWPSGVYVIRIVRNDTGGDSQILLVVRDDSSHSDLLYGTAMSDFQSYNNYGGKSLYTFNSSGATTASGTARAVEVSYDRPFEQPRSGQRDWYPIDEIATVSWLEEEGYDVSYISNTDLETSPGLVPNHKAYLSPAHDEYYSAGMRTALEQARAAGVNLFFSGSDEVYWKIRFEASPSTGQADRVQVCYKTVESGGPDPSGISTTTWRDPSGPNDPENALTGEMYVGDNDTSYFPLVVTAAEGSDRLFRYTGLDQQAPGASTSIGKNLVGWEWDARFDNGFEPAGVTTLASTPVSGELIEGNGHDTTPGSTTAMAVKYVAPSGALVFTTGTNHWNRGLAYNELGVGEPDLRIQQITTNALADMGAQPTTPASGIQLDANQNGPPAPKNLTATASGSDSVQLSWSAVTGATSYNVYRSLAARQGGLPLGTLVSSGVSGTTFADTGLASATTYYYVVTSVVSGTQSVASNEATATTAAAAGTATRIDAGGTTDYTSSTGAVYRADAFFSGGTVNSVGSRAIAGTNDPALYDTERWGQFTYTIPVANGTYDVRFHFVELYYGSNGVAGGAGKRVFGMDVLNTPTSPDLANIDIYAAVGANHAYDLTVSNVEVTNGQIGIQSVYGSADDPEVAAIEVVPVGGAPSVTSTSPADGATGVATTVTPKVTFSAPVDAATLTSSSMSLTPQGGAAVQATIAYDSGTNTATLTPAAPLAASTTYTLAVTTAVHALDGTPLAAASSTSFTTAAPAGPIVTATTPADGATGVGPSTLVQAVFDRSLDPSTVTASSFTLTGPTGAVAATVAYDDSTHTATLTPTASLALATTYTAKLTTAISSSAGAPLAAPVTWSFTTASTPPPAPTVTAQTPAPSATNVSVTTKVTATFSIAMDPSSLGSGSLGLSSPGGAVAGTVSYDAGSQTETFVPTSKLDAATVYTATVAGSVRSSQGTPLGTSLSWSFTTAAAPTVTATTPVDGSTSVATDAAVTAGFSRGMDASTITTSSFTLTGAGGAVAATVSYDAASSTARLTPTTVLPGNATYTAKLTTAVAAADGTPLAQAVTWSFTTAACPCSLFAGLTPAKTGLPVQDGRSGAGPFSYELGTKLTVDEPMKLTGISFYKSPGETGAHTGRVWTTSGTQLASASFSNETASGWQQATLATPLTLQVGSVYIVSVNANADFVATTSGLISSVGSGPIHTVADGANGVYGASAGTFPTKTYSSTNYFVDVVASPDGSVTAPTVTSVTPADGAAGVATTVAPTATFSRAVDPTTVTASSFTLIGPSGAVTGTVSYDAGSTTATFTPSAPLTAGSTYTAKVTTAVRATDGTPLAAARSWSFTVAPPTSPQVTSTAPAAGATDVGAAAIVRAVFSLALDPSTVTASTFTLKDGTTAVAGTVSYDGPTTTASLTPSAPLIAGQTYTARLDPSIATPAGGTLGTAVTWSFTVSASAGPPTIVSTTPAAGATSVSRSAPITVGFSRSMDPTTINGATITLADASGAAVAATVTYDSTSKTATLQPSATLAGQASYTATVTTGAKAADETPLAANVSWTFTTAACPCTLFSSLTPASTGLPTKDGRSGSGPFSYELGVKVTVDSPTQVTAIRFYKSPGETGTHVGRVWSSTGTLLGSTTFSGESASGWQQQTLSPAVTMQPGSTYTISVNANAFFVVTSGGLKTSATAGAVHTVADGKNGVFGSAAGVFPTQSYNTSNYFVDLVSSPGQAATPPTVVSQSPASGATGVAASTTVSATFSEALDPSTVTASNVTLTGPSGAVAASVSYDSSSNTAVLTPNAALTASASYTAKLGTGIRAADGTPLASAVSWSFSVAAPAALTVTATAPASGATGVPATVAPRATFSRALDPSTVTASTFTLTGPNGSVAGGVSYDSGTTSASLTPSSALAAGTYTARLAATVAASDGTQLGSAYSWSFTVSATAQSLTITGTTPSDGATGVSRDTSVTATFSASLDPTTVTAANVQLRDSGGSAVDATVTYDDPSRTVTLKPSSQLSGGATYTVDVSTAVHATDGTPLTAEKTWSFSTDSCPCQLFSSGDSPSSTGNPTSDGRTGSGPFSYELGVKITVDRDAELTAIRFWQDGQETGSHTGSVWSSSGSLLGSVSFSSSSGSGWQQATLSSPVQLTAGTTYVVSVGVNDFFGVTSGGLASQVSNGPLHTVADGANGVFGASAGTFPTQSYNSSNYYVDAVVQ